MTQEDLKITAINSSAMLLSFANIEHALKIVLLLASIVYTIYKIYVAYDNRKAKRSNDA